MLSVEDQIIVALRRTSHAIDVWSRQLWQDYGLTSPQLGTLREIMAGQNVTPGTLATALHLSQPTVTGILGRLERRGLIRRERSLSDRRSIPAIITEQGRELAESAAAVARSLSPEIGGADGGRADRNPCDATARGGDDAGARGRRKRHFSLGRRDRAGEKPGSAGDAADE